MAKRTLRSRMAGFTAAEMMIVVAIVAILAAIAAPNMGEMVRSQRVRTAAFDIYASLNLARSEAVKRNQTVRVRPTNGNWSEGWSVEDMNGNVYKRQEAFTALTVAGPGAVSFGATGRLTAAVGAFQVSAADVPSNKFRCIRLDLSGRAVSLEGQCP